MRDFVKDFLKGKVSKTDLCTVCGKNNVDAELIKKVRINIARHGICNIIFNTTNTSEHSRLAFDLKDTLKDEFNFINYSDTFTCIAYEK